MKCRVCRQEFDGAPGERYCCAEHRQALRIFVRINYTDKRYKSCAHDKCAQPFEVRRAGQRYCSVDCERQALAWSIRAREEREPETGRRPLKRWKKAIRKRQTKFDAVRTRRRQQKRRQLRKCGFA